MRMSAVSAIGVRGGVGRELERAPGRLHPMLLRVLLLAGCVACIVLAALYGRPAAYLSADPELARLLRAMALIKATLVTGAIGIMLWRFGYPLSGRMAAAYLAAAWAMSLATMLVWQLTLLVPSALVFHAGAIALLLVAWRDGRAALS